MQIYLKLVPIFQAWKNNLQLISLYFDTPGFDEITKDKAAKFVDRLSAIGGTFGLLTGFSLISGVEILYFLAKFLISLLSRQRNIHGFLQKIANLGKAKTSDSSLSSMEKDSLSAKSLKEEVKKQYNGMWRCY